MTKFLMTIACIISYCTEPVFAQDGDPVAKKVATAKETFYGDRDKAEKQLLELMTRRENTAKQAGDLKNLEAIRAEIAAFRSEGTLPKIVSPKDYETAMKIARTKLENAYAAAVKSYTQVEKLDEAKQMQLLLDELKGAAVPVPKANVKQEINDPFIPNSVWVNEDKNQFITVLERNKNSFRARYSVYPGNEKYIFSVNGTIENGVLFWAAKDAIESRGTASKYDCSGKIEKDDKGYLINFIKKNETNQEKQILRPQVK